MPIEDIMLWGRVHQYPYLKYGNGQVLRHGWHRWMRILALSSAEERLQIAARIERWNAYEQRSQEKIHA